MSFKTLVNPDQPHKAGSNCSRLQLMGQALLPSVESERCTGTQQAHALTPPAPALAEWAASEPVAPALVPLLPVLWSRPG